MQISTEELQEKWSSQIELFESYLVNWVDKFATQVPNGAEKLGESIKYSITSGGKRFRPLLSIFTSEALGSPSVSVLPFACAVELVHTYSLIHDDLPAMDDDDMRRGKPTNHKVYSEATAILAGDTLLTEAFGLVANHYTENPRIAVELVKEMTLASGGLGMVGGQMIDLTHSKNTPSIEQIENLHNLKTGALIRLAVVGAAIIHGASEQTFEKLSNYARDLGLAFQIADDIEDAQEGKIENFNFVHLLGLEKTFERLHDLSSSALSSIESLESPGGLRELVHFNKQRVLLN